MLARLGKTLSTNAAVGGLALLVLGAGGTTATLVAGHSPAPSPHANPNATEHPSDDASETPDPTESESPDAQDTGTRPTDTHGYCVSQVAQSATTSTDPGAHGKAVSAAAHACGKDGSATSGAQSKHGKAFGKSHGTGRPTGVTPGAPARP